MIGLFYREVLKVIETELKDFKYEIIFIDDGSSDNTLSLIKDLSNSDKNVKYVSFSRNFGKEAAIYAGLENCSGDYVVLMDADLQDPPILLPKLMWFITEEGYDCVATRRISRKGEPIIRSFCSNLFYRIMNRFTDIELVSGARDYRMMTRTMVDSVLKLNEYNRFSKGIFTWVGFKTKWLEYENIERKEGESTWSFFKLLKYSIDAIVSFSTSLIHISTIMGILFSFISFILILIIIIRTLIFTDPVAGWASTICIILFIGGIQLFCIGILGQYISKTYTETKKRPIYILKESNFN